MVRRIGGRRGGRAGAPAGRRVALAVAITALAVAGAAFAWAAGTARDRLPEDRVAAARRSLAAARAELAGAPSPDLDAAAARAAELEIRTAAARAAWAPFGAAEPLAALAAEVEALTRRARWRHRVALARGRTAGAARLAELAARLEAETAAVDQSPADRRLRRASLGARLSLERAGRALDDGRLADAGGELDRAATEVAAVEARAGRQRERFDDREWLSRWQGWVDATVAATRTGGEAVIVVKHSRRAYLVRGARVAAAYAAELGRAGLADKVHAGDAATPEGRYRVTEKRDRGATRFYRALMLDYPNAENRRRFAADRRRGLVPPGRGIGGLIEIHGEGGRGSNWTDGCVALANPDMDRLFAAVRVGTPVTIVGSARLPGVEEVAAR